MAEVLPAGCALIGRPLPENELQRRLAPWRDPVIRPGVLVVLAATRTAEVEGISAAGATAASRRYTAIADAELLLQGPSVLPRWPLPPLPAGVSPALISWTALQRLALVPEVAALGLPQSPPFPHLRLEPVNRGASACLSTGQAMPLDRVQQLWAQGKRWGSRLRRPLVLAECVPGGTTTAQAVLEGLDVSVGDLVSGSALHPPQALKQRLVAKGLALASLPRPVQPQALVAAVGDPFQALAAGLVVGAFHAHQPLLLAGGSQMLAVIALALSSCDPCDRAAFAQGLTLGTTAWLAGEQLGEPTAGRGGSTAPAFAQVLQRVESRFDSSLLALASGLRCHASRHHQLRAYEQGHVKEGVGAGGLSLLAMLQGVSAMQLLEDCDRAMDALLAQPRGSADGPGGGGGSLGSNP